MENAKDISKLALSILKGCRQNTFIYINKNSNQLLTQQAEEKSKDH